MITAETIPKLPIKFIFSAIASAWTIAPVAE
jgi:hypothetical protein